MTIDSDGCVLDAKVGELVWDDLCARNAKIEQIEYSKGEVVPKGQPIAYWLECTKEEIERTGGARFPWEISPPKTEVKV